MSKRRVCITGIGLVSPVGLTREATWQAVLAGESGADYIKQFDARTWPTKFACEVKDFAFDESSVAKEHATVLNRPGQFGAVAAHEAWLDAGLGAPVPNERLGVAIGTAIGAISPLQLSQMLTIPPQGDGLRGLFLRNHPATLAAVLASKWQALGPISTIQTACASSGQAVGQAYMHVRRGEADVMIAGGADSLMAELLLTGFCLLGALSTRNSDPKAASRPFDRDRDGFVAGEGSAVLILEDLEHAKAREAKIYCEIAGYGETESAYRITDLPENGRGVVEAMQLALTDGSLAVSDVGYINAHGTSTALNDRVEALAIRRVFGARGSKPLVGSTKCSIGHLISAAGAMEAAFCALAIRDQKVPPNRNLQRTDCGEDINFLGETAVPVQLNAALSNSVGFGGSNSVVALKRVQ